jgi:dimethylargininase
MVFNKAITRKPGPDFAAGITSVTWTRPPDYRLICRQHQAYIDTLRHLGLEVVVLDPEPGLPDAYFVEDTAVILGGTAVVTRSGASARMAEAQKMATVLKEFKKVESIRPPGLLDGGDVMVTGNQVFVGLSGRTNREGARQLGGHAARLGFSWSAVPVLKALHLKSGVNAIDRNTLLMCREYAQRPEFDRYDKILVDEEELPAANTLWVNGTLLTPAGHPRTLKKLKSLGMPLIELGVSEVMKMDGGLSCLSLRF